MKKIIYDKILSICKWAILSILFLFMIIILSRILTQQVLVKGLDLDNKLIRIVGFGRNAQDISIDVLKSEIVGNDENNMEWELEYPFHSNSSSKFEEIERVISKYEEKIISRKENLEFYTTESLFGKSVFEKIGEKYNDLIGWNLATSQGDLIFLENGYLTNKVEKVADEEIAELVESVDSLYTFVKQKDIDFLYVNAGSKVCPYDKQLPYGCEEYTNENADALLTGLSEEKIPYLDLRDEMISDNLDWYNAYYQTDHHWKTSTGLWAAGKIAETLNERYEYSFDLGLFDEKSYEILEYPDLWLGGQGRVVGFEYAKKEAYERILPLYTTDYTVEIPSEKYCAHGDYSETMFKQDLLEDVLSYSDTEILKMPDAYHCSRFNNNDLARIYNNSNTKNDGKKILILQDSFSWYLTSFLASDIEQIDIITCDKFDGSIQTYIEKTNPDMVLVMYCARNITPVEWTHRHMFDFR